MDAGISSLPLECNILGCYGDEGDIHTVRRFPRVRDISYHHSFTGRADHRVHLSS
jgi:hypothetical protein